MGTLIRAVVIALFMGAAAGASSIPTPAPGSGTAVAVPTPVNPTQYNVAAGQIGSSNAQNSNFYKVYNDLNAVINTLNGCTWVPGPAVGVIAATSPIQASLSSCAANAGTGVTLSLSLGTVPAGNLPGNVVYSGQSPTFTNIGATGTLTVASTTTLNTLNTAGITNLGSTLNVLGGTTGTSATYSGTVMANSFSATGPVQGPGGSSATITTYAPPYTATGSGGTILSFPAGTHTFQVVIPVTVTTGLGAGVLVGSTINYYFPSGGQFTTLSTLVCQSSVDGGGGSLSSSFISKTVTYFQVGLYSTGNLAYTSPVNVDVTCTGD